MRQHICKKCGKIYMEKKEDSWYCPDCAAESCRNVIRRKVCAMCGKEFDGYPRSKYCPECRIIARREADRRHRKNGTARPIGSTDLCENCGKPYTVNSARQRYCPDCRKTMWAENTRKYSREYNRQHAEELNAYKAEMRKDRRVCAVCGKPFSSPVTTVTCSPECAAEQKRRIRAAVDVRRGRAAPARIISKMEHTNSSGVPGITWHKKTQKWQLKIHGKYIGLFATVEEAQAAKEKIEKT